MNHMLRKCRSHGFVIGSRCRCPVPHKVLWTDCDDKCPPPDPDGGAGSEWQDQMAANADMARLRSDFLNARCHSNADTLAVERYVTALMARIADLEEEVDR